MSDIGLVVYGAVAFFVGIFSAVVGGGGGFVTTPLMIFLGLSPAEAIANGKFMGVSVTLSNIQVMRKQKLHDWSIVIPFMVLAVIIALGVPQVITRIEGDVYQKVIGLFILAMVPVIHLTKVGHQKRVVASRHKKLGYIAVSASMLLVGVFSSGLGVLIGLSMSSFLGMGALEANITKRLAQLLLNSVIILGLIGSGLFVWKVVFVGIVVNYIGGYIGSRWALKKGNVFVMNVLKAVMVLSGISLLVV